MVVVTDQPPPRNEPIEWAEFSCRDEDEDDAAGTVQELRNDRHGVR